MRLRRQERMVRMLSVAGNESSVLDFTGQGIRRVEAIPNAWPTTLIYDRNAISKIENLDQYKDSLQQLSFAENQLTRMNGVARLTCLTMLNLPHNSITAIDGLKNLTRLTWLNLSGNCLKTAENLHHSLVLQHLDLSDNSLSALPDLSSLKQLKSLLLHGNLVTTLQSAPTHLPPSLKVLSLAENDMDDLNEVAFLSTLPAIEQLSIMNNPCVIMTGPHPGFDYRPFVVNWCSTLNFLDGYQVSEKERLKAEWLFSQGRGRHFRPGQHYAMVQYLASVCPLTAASELESMEDQKLARILQHQRLHQASLEDETRSSQGQLQGQVRRGPTPSRGESPKIIPKEQPRLNSPGDPGRVGPSHRSPSVHPRHVPDTERTPQQQQQQQQQAELQIQDVTSSDDSHSLLDCETRYIPLHTTELLTSPTKTVAPGSSPPVPRPLTAPPAGRPPETLAPDEPPPERPASDMDVVPEPGSSGSHGARRMAANFPPLSAASKAGHVDSVLHTQSPPRRAAAKGQEVAGGGDSDSESMTSASGSESSATLQLQLLKAILQNRKTKKAIRKSLHDVTQSTKSALRGRPDADSGRTGVDDEVEQVMMNRDEEEENDEDDAPAPSRSARHTKKERQAALRLQASWRGYLARHRDPEVLRVRHELRSRRAEDHINYLRNEVDRQRLLYEQEKQLRAMQLEAMKQLWRQVQTLQQWKDDVLISQELSGPAPPPPHESINETTKELIETLEKSSLSQEDATQVMSTATSDASAADSGPVRQALGFPLPQPQPSRSVDVAASSHMAGSQKEAELEFACRHLQQQVSHLQEVLTSVSNFVFQGGANDKEESGISVLPPSSSSILPAPPPGIPTPPGALRAVHQAAGSVYLQWTPATITDAQGQPSPKFLLGYRVYVNDQAKGMVSATQHHSLLEGLSQSQHYRIFLRAVSAIGESTDSNVVVVVPSPAGEDIRLSQVNPGNDDGDDDSASGPGKENRDTSQRPCSQTDGKQKGDGSGSASSHPPDPGPSSGGSSGSNPRDAPTSRIPTLRNRNLLHVQFDSADLDLSRGSTTTAATTLSLGGTKGSCATLEGSSRGSGLETDSGYLTTAGSLAQKTDSRLSTKASVAPSLTIETVAEEPARRRATVLERLEQKLKTGKDSSNKDTADIKQTSPLSTQEGGKGSVAARLLEAEKAAAAGSSGGSPRIQEGLIRTREKGMLGELKFAAKIHKRRNESPTPLKAMPSELNRAEAIASELSSGRREAEAPKCRSGVVVESPERLPKYREMGVDIGPVTKPRPESARATRSSCTERKEGSPSKGDAGTSPQPTPERRASDSRVDHITEGEKGKVRTATAGGEVDDKLKAYFSRHDSLRYRVKMPNRPRTRHNSGGEEQAQSEKDTSSVSSALEKYREKQRKAEAPVNVSDVHLQAEKPLVEKRVSSLEKRTSPASSMDKRSSSGDPHSPTSTFEKRSSPNSTYERRSPIARAAPSRAHVEGSEKRTSVIDSTGIATTSQTRETSSGRTDRNPPPVPPRPSRLGKDSGLRTRSPSPGSRQEKSRDRCTSPSPGKSRSERSREPSPASSRHEWRSERSREASPGGEVLVRRGSMRRRNASTGSEASEEHHSGSSSPRKMSSDEASHSSPSKHSSSDNSRSESSRSESSRSSSHRHSSRQSSPSSNIPLPVSDQHRDGRSRLAVSSATEATDSSIARHTRGRRSAREPRSHKKVEVSQRSSSVGAVTDRAPAAGAGSTADTAIVTDKPPVAKRDSSRDNAHKGSRENVSSSAATKPPVSRGSSKEDISGRRSSSSSSRRRTHSEHSAAGSSEDDDGSASLVRSASRESVSDRKSSSGDRASTGSGDMTEALQAALLAPAKTPSPREKETSVKKPLLKHKRSNSDLSGIRALPDRPESPAPKEWKPATPAKPSQAPSSPRVIRSSSFSKVLPGDASQGSPDALLRQCISLETLKAAKSHDVGHFEAKRSQSEAAAAAAAAAATSTTASSAAGSSSPSTASAAGAASGGRSHDSPPSTGLGFDKAAVVRRSLERCYGRNLGSSGGSDKGSSSGRGGSGASGGADADGAGSQRAPRPHSMGVLERHSDELRSASDGATRVRAGSDSSSVYARHMLEQDGSAGMEYDEDVMEVAREMEKLHALPAQAIGADDRSSRMEELRERRTKLGSKAADLFAKLQQRLSASKT